MDEIINIDSYFDSNSKYLFSYSSLNTWNILFAYFWIFLLLIIIINVYLQLLLKVNKGTNKKFYNLFQLLYGDTNNMFSNRSEDLDPIISKNVKILDASVNLVEDDLGNQESGLVLKVNNLDINDVYKKI